MMTFDDNEEQVELIMLPTTATTPERHHKDKLSSSSSPTGIDHNNEHEHGHGHPISGGGISDWEAGVSLAKAIMGAGSFALPWAFSTMGYVAGPIFLFALMFLSIYSLKLLVQCARTTMQHSYVDVARAIFGTTGARLAYAASVSASIGVCGSYLVFISANMQSLLESNISQSSFILFVLPIAVALSSVRDMKHFAFASLLGDISVVLGMVVVLVYGILYHSDHLGKGCFAVGYLSSMALGSGAIGFLFLVHFLSLPIESAMAHPENFYSVATITFAVCAIFSGMFGVLGYLLFGRETQQIVLMNVRGSFFVSAVKLLLCIDLLLTYPVVMRPSIVIVEQSLNIGSNTFRTKHHHHHVVGWTTHVVVCVVLGLVAAGSSIFIPAFGLLSGLVGGVSQTFLAFVLPPLMLSHLQHPNGVFGIQRNDVVLVSLGLVLIVWTLVSTWSEVHKGIFVTMIG